VLEKLQDIAIDLRRVLSGLEPDRLSTHQAAAVVEAAAEVERLAGSIKLLAASRASKSRRWAAEGHRSAAGWIADKTLGSFGDAISTLETSARLDALPQTAEALRRGEISPAQAKEVAVATRLDPRAEGELLEVAARGSMKKLKERARDVAARSGSKQTEIARYRAIHKSRYLRHWSDIDGGFRLDARLAPDCGARLVACIDSEAKRLADEAESRGKSLRPEASKADALVELVTSAGPPAGRARSRGAGRGTDSVVVRVDAQALRRGFVKGTETCEIRGVGPVPVVTARRVLGDSFVKIIVTDGVDVKAVCHVGRTVDAHVLSALEERDRECVVPGCEVTERLESHHFLTDFAECGTTSLDGLARVCKRHHDLITYKGYKLTGGPGKWALVGPRTRAQGP
jgi:hypothetical protein